jgi:5-enolpyruvylshikimate-3-phosphate synthase
MTVNIDDLVEVKLKEADDFLKVKETLTRIGVASRKEARTVAVFGDRGLGSVDR